MSVHDIQGLFEAAILNKANYFTVKGSHVIPVFVQYCDRRRQKGIKFIICAPEISCPLGPA